jgi:F-type H+-transporting ATPase subunit delta
MQGTTISRRYGRAIFDLANEESRATDVLCEIKEIAALCESHSGLADVLYRPIQPLNERLAVWRAIVSQGAISGLVKNFCSYLIENGRMIALPAIGDELERLVDEAAGITRGEVIAAAPLSDEELGRLRSALSARVGSQLDLTVRVDPNLIGGLIARVGDLVFDGSLQTQLDQLRSNLTKGH